TETPGCSSSQGKPAPRLRRRKVRVDPDVDPLEMEHSRDDAAGGSNPDSSQNNVHGRLCP
ncbi:MAG: hypothetical protein KGO50_10705, partial [Myxococcales bacterium]|nr:hypothetical protein [Myxococcales bacterium]